MQAWVRDGKVHFILPSEYDPEDMGPIYEVSWYDHENLEEVRLAARQAQRASDAVERRLAAKLVKEQNND